VSIIWKPWNDPVAPLLKGKVVEPYEPEEDEFDPAYVTARDTFGADDRPSPYGEELQGGYKGPIVVGPIGLVPIQEANLPSSLFNFWMGHTTFRLTGNHEDAIEGVDGVETLDVFTPYRFRVGVGRAFDDRKVRKAIELVCEPPALPRPRILAGQEAVKAIMGRKAKSGGEK
jgi:hypothetical protein